MLYSICFLLYGFLVLLRQGIARGSPPGTTTEVQRVGFLFMENRFVSRPAPPPGRSVWGGPPRGPLRPGGLFILLDASFLGAKSR
jgi:hypothetical protein